MAEKLTEESANREHNIADIKNVIRECAQRMNEIDDQRAELNEDAAGIRERLKNAGVQNAAFMFARKLDKMEAEARNEYLDSLRVNMEAMNIGGQGTLFIDDQPQSAAAE